jgi:hypothetical protein
VVAVTLVVLFIIYLSAFLVFIFGFGLVNQRLNFIINEILRYYFIYWDNSKKENEMTKTISFEQQHKESELGSA